MLDSFAPPAGPFPRTSAAIAAELRFALAAGQLDLPFPGQGATLKRWAALAGFARRDAVFGRLAEGHTDAVAILAEADRKAAVNCLYGVWAARSAGTGAILRGRLLQGTVRFCSGAHSVDRALVAALPVEQADGRGVLVEVDMADTRVKPIEGTWVPYGMAASDSPDVRFEDVPVSDEMIVGEPGFYLERTGFWAGGAGVAAVWLGAAAGVLDATTEYLREGRGPDEHQFAHLGALHAAMRSAEALLVRAAADLDEAPDRDHVVLAGTCRAAVEKTAWTVADRVPRITGPTPLCRDEVFGQRLADLVVYVRQHHAERDLAALGRVVFEQEGI